MRRAVAVAVFLLLLAAGGASARVGVGPIIYTPNTLPQAQLGQPYDVTITATRDGQYLDLGVNASTGLGVPGLTYGKGAPVPTFGGASLRIYGTPKKASTYTVSTEIIGSDGSAVDDRNWVLVVKGGKPELTYAQAQAYVKNIQDAMTGERKARDEILLRTQEHLSEAASLLTHAESDLYQVTAGLPDHTYSGPNPVPNTKAAYRIDGSVEDVLREAMAGNNHGKGIDKPTATKLVNELGPALTQKKHALSYMKQIAGRLAP